jgi:hypothetical protein
MIITRTSTLSGHISSMDITLEQMASWEQGELVQNAMPNLSADEREFIMTGITPTEWNEMFN